MKSTSLFSIIKAKYQLQPYGTEKEKIEFPVKKFTLFEILFLYPGNGKDLKTSSNQKKTKET